MGTLTDTKLISLTDITYEYGDYTDYDIVITRNFDGMIVCVSIQDDDHKIIKVLWER